MFNFADDIQGKKLKLAISNFLKGQNQPAEWLDGIFISFQNSNANITLLHEYFAKWFNEHKKNIFEEIFYNLTKNKNINYNYQIYKHCIASEKNCKPLHLQQLDEFIDNGKNKAVLTALNLAVSNFEKKKYLILLFGSSGTGKTLLLQTVQKELYKNYKIDIPVRKTAVFCQQDHFYQKIICNSQYLKKNNILLLDDLQDIAPYPEQQIFLANCIDLMQNGIIVFTWSDSAFNSDRLEKKLSARLDAGLILKLKEPDIDLRLRYLEILNQKNSLGLAKNQILQIARQISQFGKLQGIIKKIELFTSIDGKMQDFEAVEKMFAEKSDKDIKNWHDIIKNLAERFNLKTEDILSARRNSKLVLCRQIAMYILRRQFGFSYTEIGKIFNGKDHSTIIYAINKIAKLLKNDKDMHKLITEMETIFK